MDGARLDQGLAAGWQEPASLSDRMDGLLDLTDLTFTFGTPDFCRQDLDLAMSWTDAPERDPVRYTMKGMSREALTFRTVARDWALPLSGEDRELFDAAWGGQLVEGSTEVRDLVLTGLLDVGELELDGTNACVLAESLGDDCIACPDDGLHGCLPVRVELPDLSARGP